MIHHHPMIGTRLLRQLTCFAVLLSCLSTGANAQVVDDEMQEYDTDLAIKQPVIEPWRAEGFVSFAYGDEGEIATAHLGLEKRVGSNREFGIAPQLALGLAQNTDDDLVLINGFDLVLRSYVHQSDQIDIFLEVGGGLQYTGPTSLPRNGTHVNFRVRGGAGLAYRLDDDLDLLAGVNWFHISNANLLQPNNGHDGPMFYLGLRKEF